VQKAVDIALTVKETYAGIDFETVNTFTMPLRDLIVEGEEILGEEMRFNSGICIKITKKQ
jgi:hypothetical protein